MAKNGSKSGTAIYALAVVAHQVGMVPSASAQEAIIRDERCEYLLGIEERWVLLEELEELIDNDPDNPCVPMLIGMLGKQPVGQIPTLLFEDPPVTPPSYSG